MLQRSEASKRDLKEAICNRFLKGEKKRKKKRKKVPSDLTICTIKTEVDPQKKGLGKKHTIFNDLVDTHNIGLVDSSS